MRLHGAGEILLASVYTLDRREVNQSKGDGVTETALFLELVKSIGFPALIFAVWYLYHRAQVKAWEAREAAQIETFKAQMQTMNEHEARMFKLLDGQLEALQCIAAQNARMETKLDSNMFCPMVREKAHA